MSKRIARNATNILSATAATASSTAVLEPPSVPESLVESAIDVEREPAPPARKGRIIPASATARHFPAASNEEHGANRQAELFYLQKQIQLQTQMVFILEDGARIQGVIEWYDRNSIKVRGKSRTLLYKSAIKYLYKAGEVGSATE